MRATLDRQGNISVPDFLNLAKWAEIRKQNKTKLIAWQTVKLAVPLAIANYAAFAVDLKKHPEMRSEHIFDATLSGALLAFIFVFMMWCCMESSWLYMEKKLLEKSSLE